MNLQQECVIFVNKEKYGIEKDEKYDLAIIGVIIGFVLLVKGADFFVEGSGSVAKKFNIPVFIIGMTIVAMGPVHRNVR